MSTTGGDLRRGGRRGPGLPRRLLRRRPVLPRRHVRPRPGAGRGRAGPRLPPRRHHRPGQLDPSGFIGHLLRTVGRHVPPPAGVRPPTQWGAEERLNELLGGAVSRLVVTPRTSVFRFRSPEDFAGFFREKYGPTRKAFEALDEPGRERLSDDLTALARDHDREPGPSVAMPSEYLEAVATRR